MTLSHYASCCDHTVYCLYIRVIIQNPKWIRCNLLTVPYLSIFTYMEPNPLRKSSTPSLKAVQNVRHSFNHCHHCMRGPKEETAPSFTTVVLQVHLLRHIARSTAAPTVTSQVELAASQSRLLHHSTRTLSIAQFSV